MNESIFEKRNDFLSNSKRFMLWVIQNFLFLRKCFFDLYTCLSKKKIFQCEQHQLNTAKQSTNDEHFIYRRRN